MRRIRSLSLVAFLSLSALAAPQSGANVSGLPTIGIGAAHFLNLAAAGYPEGQESALGRRLFSLASTRGFPVRFDYAARRPDFLMDLTVSYDAEGKTLIAVVALVKGRTEEEEGEELVRTSLFLSSADEIERRVPIAMAAAWARSASWENLGPDPLPVSEVSTVLLNKLAGTYEASTPMDLAMGPGGRLCLPIMSSFATLGGDFRFLGALNPEGIGSATYFLKAAVAKDGTLAATTTAPGELYRFRPGDPRGERLSTGLKGFGRLLALADGSFLMDDMGQGGAKIVRGRRAEPAGGLRLQPGSALAADSDGRLWTWDQTAMSARVFSADGAALEEIPAILPAEYGDFYPSMIVPLPGGSFLLANSSQVLRLDGTGTIRARIDSPCAASDPENALTLCAVAADPASGSIYLLDQLKKLVVRYDDPGLGGQTASRAPAAVLAAAAALRVDPDSAPAALSLVSAWKEAGAEEAAASLADGFAQRMDEPSIAEIDRTAELSFDRRSCLVLLRQANALLSSKGTESAKATGSLALQAMEAYLARAGGDVEIRRLQDDLRARLYGLRPALPPKELLQVVSATVDDLFPARSPAYASRPPARIVLRNVSGSPLARVSLSFMIDGYMDAPSELSLPEGLAAGAEVSLPVPVILSPAALGLDEDLRLKARFGIEASSADALDSRSVGVDALIHRASAISWADSASLASFVTPNDQAVAFFASRAQAAAGGDWLTRSFARSSAVLEAAGGLGILYTPDPAGAPGPGGALDTVRFPRKTLELRSGDCDDSTALCASLLESIGVPTAILTTPGHVLFAFDPGDPSLAWLFSGGGYGCIKAAGRAWIPVETTVLSKGFAAAWEAGSAAWDSAGQRELIPLAQARASYPALALQAGMFMPAAPDLEALASRLEASRAAVTRAILDPLAARLEAEAAAGQVADRQRALNKLAILEASTGNASAAEARLRSAVALGGASAQSWANLATLLSSVGRKKEALTALEEGLKASPSSAVLRKMRSEAAGSPVAGEELVGSGPRDALSSSGQAPGQRGSEAGAPAQWIVE